MRFFSELKRRNVLRMGGVYLVAAWATIEVADVLIGMLGLPDWIGPGLIIVLTIGFPIALLVSWFYEVTPHGVTAEKDIPADDPEAHTSDRRADFIIIGVLAAAVILFAYDKWWPDEPEERSIAVLAFENMSNDPDQEYFADGISEEILNLLAQIKPLHVKARTSSFSFKGRNVDIATMAEQLNVRHILEGSVRRSGDRVRITAQLIDASDSSHLWSQTFDRALTANNLFVIQSEIARAITERLRMTLTEVEEQHLSRMPTDNTEAYEAYLLGRERLRDRTVERLAQAAEQFALAIRLDPDYATAYAGLVDACLRYRGYSGGHVHPDCPAAEGPSYAEDLLPLARKALELDDTVGEAWIAYADLIGPKHIRAKSDRIEEVTNAYERGLELNPTFSDAYVRYARFLTSHARVKVPEGATVEEEREIAEKVWREWQDGLAGKRVLQRGLEVDPLSLQLHRMASDYPLFASTPEESMYHTRRIVEIAPDSPLGYWMLTHNSWMFEGRVDQAIKWGHTAAEIDPEATPGFLGLAYIALGDFEMASAYLDLERQMLSPELQEDPWLEEAMIHLYSGRRDEAIALLEQMQDESMGGAYIHWPQRVLAGLDLESGDAKKALARYQEYQPECFDREDGVRSFEVCPMFGLARVYQELGNEEWGRDIFQEWWDTGGSVADRYWRPMLGDNSVTFMRAGVLTLMNKRDEALDFLEEAVRQGWRGGARHETDWRFFAYFDTSVDAIRDDPRFRAAISVIEADMAQQLENVRAMERRGEIPSLEDLKASLQAARE